MSSTRPENNGGEEITFHISKGSETFGPWTLDEIAVRLAKSEIAVTDFIFDEGKEEWVLLLEFEPLKAKLRSTKPKATPPRRKGEELDPVEVDPKVEKSAPVSAPNLHITTSAQGSRQAEAEWFVNNGAHKFGPLTYLGLIKALQEKSVFEFDYIWKSGMEDWVRLAEHEEFNPSRIRQVMGEIAQGETSVFHKRRHQRIPFACEIMVHNNQSLWMGRALEASAGGATLAIENATLMPGQTVLVHFSGVEGLSSFNVLCEIVNKRFRKDIRGPQSPVVYGVRFVQVETSAEKKVQDYFAGEAKEVASPVKRAAASASK